MRHYNYARHRSRNNGQGIGGYEGVIALEWNYRECDQRLDMTWLETGGPTVVTPKRKGFGSALIQRALKYELDAEVDLQYLPEGVTCRIGTKLNYQEQAAKPE